MAGPVTHRMSGDFFGVSQLGKPGGAKLAILPGGDVSPATVAKNLRI